jgi:hypothetical protein
MTKKEAIVTIFKQAILIAIVAYALIVIAVYAIPHLPLANRRTFHVMLKTQMAFDREKETQQNDRSKMHLLCLGSSVVERGVNAKLLDSLLTIKHNAFYVTNSAAGGFFANANRIMFRAMLEKGLRPARVVYGIFLQELNGKSSIHGNVSNEDTAYIKLKDKSIWNVIRYGPASLASVLEPVNFHIYLFALNNAFTDAHNPNFIQRLAFGENLFERDSSFIFDSSYFENLKGIYFLCKQKNIPFAFFNTPVRPDIESLSDLPYQHRLGAYAAVEKFALANNLPIWNFDTPKVFSAQDFLDTYHLTPDGAKKMTTLLADKISTWNKGMIEQDITDSSSYSIHHEIKDSLIRTMFHF